MPAKPVFDLEDVYDAEISPLMAKIIVICKAHGLPMFAAFCYRHDGAAGGFSTTVIERPGAGLPESILKAIDAFDPDNDLPREWGDPQ